MSWHPFRRGLTPFGAWLSTAVLGILHGWAIWTGLGGAAGLGNGWPIWRDDHPLYLHTALVTRPFLSDTGTTAGYDPSFMAGYAKSVVFPSSSTLPELVVWAIGGTHPELAYKMYVLVSAALVPWLLACGGRFWQVRSWPLVAVVLLGLVYVWTDFPINYVGFGMLPYFLGVPLGLAATGAFCVYLEWGKMRWWLVSACAMAGAVLVHFTTCMVVAPAAALAYGMAVFGRGQSPRDFPIGRHVGVVLIPVVVLAFNAFWWLPGLWLASTKGPSGFAFSHSDERVSARLAQIVSTEAPIESVLWALGLAGLAALAARDRVRAAALAGFAASGFFWGYLAGATPALDFLQPGRHTYALYLALAVASGVGITEGLARLRQGEALGGLDRWAVLGLVLVGGRFFGPAMYESVRMRMGGPQSLPFLTSDPPARLRWILQRVKTHMKRGERLLYEEGGFAVEGVADPFQGGRFSGLIPDRTGIELLGGPYLHASLTSNFTQFGEGKLFGQERWGRDHFVRYARLYRPAFILCWTPWSRGFCRANPDLVEVVDDDGTLLFGRVIGFGGNAIEGSAEVVAEPGRLRIKGAMAGVDGTVVLRYHSVPCLLADPPVRWEPVFLEGDPTPFIRIRPPLGPFVLKLRIPPSPQSRGETEAE